MKSLLRQVIDKDEILCISKLNGKLEKFNAISTYTLENNFCIKMNNTSSYDIICKYCYSHESLSKGIFPSLNKALKRNSRILSTRLLSSKEIKEFYIFNSHSFRFNAHGELINELHLKNLVNICLHNENINFGLWSKRKDLIRKYFKVNKKPSNLILIYSNPIINNILPENKIPEYFDKSFNNVYHDVDIKKQNCTGQKCISCLKCYKHDTTKTIVEAIKFNGRVKKDLPKIVVVRKSKAL